MRAFKWTEADEVRVKRNGEGKLGCCCADCSAEETLDLTFDSVGTGCVSCVPIEIDPGGPSARTAYLTGTFTLTGPYTLTLTMGVWVLVVPASFAWTVYDDSGCTSVYTSGTADITLAINCAEGAGYQAIAAASFTVDSTPIQQFLFTNVASFTMPLSNTTGCGGTATIDL